MIRISTLIWLVLSVVAATSLFNISQKTENQRHTIATLDRQIAFEHESLAVLRAEWSYLTTPSRLRKLATKHLDLDSIIKPPHLGQDEIAIIETTGLSIEMVKNIVLDNDDLSNIAHSLTIGTRSTDYAESVKNDLESTNGDIDSVIGIKNAENNTNAKVTRPTPRSFSLKRPNLNTARHTPKIVPIFVNDEPTPSTETKEAARSNTDRGFGDVLNGLGTN